MKYTSASGMHFRDRSQWSVVSGQGKIKLIISILYLASAFFLLFTVHCSLFTDYCHAEVLDRVVAIVDDEAIMLSELNEAYKKAVDTQKEVTKDDVLNGLINRALLLNQAKKRFSYGFQLSKDDNTLINEYIDRQLKSFIRIPIEEIEQYYEKNKQSFGNKDFYDVRDKIEELLIEKELNKRLIRHIEELRKNAYIKVQMEEGSQATN